MKPRKYLDKEADICAAYMAGEMHKDIAKRFGVPLGSVARIIARRVPLKNFADSKRQKIIATFDPQTPPEVIAERVGCCPEYVRAVARECGLWGAQ